MKNTHIDPNHWVTLSKAQDIFGYTPAAFRGKISRKQLVQGVHWRKAPDRNVIINVGAFNDWLLSVPQQ